MRKRKAQGMDIMRGTLAQDTRYGKINNLRVPRDRENEFQTALFDRYQRNVGIDDLVVSMYSKGVSTRKMAEILEELFHNRYSKSTISRITDITIPEISKWRSRPLDRRYIAIFMDAMFFSPDSGAEGMCHICNGDKGIRKL